MRNFLLLTAIAITPALPSAVASFAAENLVVTISPPITVVEREGITGAGWATVVGTGSRRRVEMIYPNHPDDFGGSAGTGCSRSTDGGMTWVREADDRLIPKMVDLWQDRLRDGTLIAVGIRRLPDPELRAYADTNGPPSDAYAIGISNDEGRTWSIADAVLHCPVEFGTIARPLPHVFESKEGAWLMPAYAWSQTGNRALLLQSEDRGRSWNVRSTIAASAEIRESETTVTTPWLETMVAQTSDGSLLAAIRTGSNEHAALVVARSTDDGRSWSPPQKLLAGREGRPVVGKLPNLLLLPNGMLALLTAHTKLGCRLYLSSDGTGHEWSDAQIITTVSGGNTSMTPLDKETLLVFTPSSRRITCRRVTLSSKTSR